MRFGDRHPSRQGCSTHVSPYLDLPRCRYNAAILRRSICQGGSTNSAWSTYRHLPENTRSIAHQRHQTSQRYGHIRYSRAIAVLYPAIWLSARWPPLVANKKSLKLAKFPYHQHRFRYMTASQRFHMEYSPLTTSGIHLLYTQVMDAAERFAGT